MPYIALCPRSVLGRRGERKRAPGNNKRRDSIRAHDGASERSKRIVRPDDECSCAEGSVCTLAEVPSRSQTVARGNRFEEGIAQEKTHLDDSPNNGALRSEGAGKARGNHEKNKVEKREMMISLPLPKEFVWGISVQFGLIEGRSRRNGDARRKLATEGRKKKRGGTDQKESRTRKSGKPFLAAGVLKGKQLLRTLYYLSKAQGPLYRKIITIKPEKTKGLCTKKDE